MDCFRDLMLGQVPRILGLGDRDNDSATFGCFDRYYWHYRFLDFPNLRFQEVALLLVLLWRENFPGNIYFANRKIAEWADAAIQFWLRSRNRDGSVAEAYLFERSFCATAFSTWTITEGLLLLGRDAPPGLRRTADWLVKYGNPAVANQMAAAAVALRNCYLLTGVEKYRVAAQAKMATLLREQDPAGYFPEYGGYDTGYLSITLSCLAKYYEKTQDRILGSAMSRALQFLEVHVREDGCYDIKGTSRRTQFLYPYGLAWMKSSVIEKLRKGLKANRIINPAWLDDRYVIQMATNYLQAYLVLRNANDHSKIDRAEIV